MVKVEHERLCYNPDSMKEPQSQRKRVFSYEEAAALLPEVRRLTEAAYERAQSVGAGLSSEGALGTEDQERLAAIVQAWAESLKGKGLEVKGLWLVDFDNGSGYYCWRYPEAGLQFYHSYDDGLRGRMRIQ
jgi:hypothetical protein